MTDIDDVEAYEPCAYHRHNLGWCEECGSHYRGARHTSAGIISMAESDQKLIASLHTERDALAAQVAVLREALQALPGAVSMAGEAGGWVWLAEWEGFEGRVTNALAAPAPRADALLAVVAAARRVVVVTDQERFGSESPYNAPGHAHLTPPYWDMGEECERCRAWMTLLDTLARFDGEGE